jgi:5'-3' exonuclease
MIIVDGSSLLHRVLNTSQAELQDSKGRFTGGVHGFLISLGALALKHRLKHQFIVAWDNGIPLFRREIYKEYKSWKVPTGSVDEKYLSEQNLLSKEDNEAPDEFMKKYIMARNLLHKVFLPKTGCLSVQVANCEADDILGHICCQIEDENIIILSCDRDLIQLLTPNRSFYDGKTQDIIEISDVVRVNKLIEDKWLTHWMIARAMCGDGSDGIPGCGPGWGACVEYARQIIEMGDEIISECLPKLTRIPGGRTTSFEGVKKGELTIKRNIRLMDLRLPTILDLPIVQDIKTQFASCFIHEVNPDEVELELHEMQMTKAKSYASMIIESNLQNESIEYIRRLS